MPHHSNTKGTAALNWIVAEAKKITKKHPNKEWKSCIKEAAVEYRKRKK